MDYRIDRLNFSHLFYFYVTAKEGSIKGACEKLFISQPTISDQIKLLEEFLDCELFERRNRALFLTREGEVALEYAEELFSLSREFVRRMRKKEKLPRRSIEIGVTPFMSQYLLYQELTTFFTNPDFMVNFTEAEAPHLLSLLEDDEIDILYSSSKLDQPKNLVSLKLGTNKTFILAHKKFKKHLKNFPNCLNEIPYFAHSQGSDLRYESDLYFVQNGLNPTIIGEGDGLELFEVICQQGLGFVVVPEVGKNRLEKDKDIITLGELSELQSNVYATVKKDNTEVIKYLKAIKASKLPAG